MYVGVLSVRCGRSGVWFLPPDVFLHHCAVYWHPPHGGENHPHVEHSGKLLLQFHEKYMNHLLLHLSVLTLLFNLIVSALQTVFSCFHTYSWLTWTGVSLPKRGCLRLNQALYVHERRLRRPAPLLTQSPCRLLHSGTCACPRGSGWFTS